MNRKAAPRRARNLMRGCHSSTFTILPFLPLNHPTLLFHIPRIHVISIRQAEKAKLSPIRHLPFFLSHTKITCESETSSCA